MSSDSFNKCDFEDLIGQENAIEFLKAVIEKKRLGNAYLFSGPFGVGKKLAAMRFLEGLLSKNSKKKDLRRKLESRNHPDLLWVEPTFAYQGKLIEKSIAELENINIRSTSQIRLEQIKKIREFLGKNPVESSFGMVVIEDIDEINESAANALLKTLEEPNHGVFILISERPERLLSTIRSRCQNVLFNRLNSKSVENIFRNKNEENSYDNFYLKKEKELLKISHGSPGAIKKNIEIWESLPEDLISTIKDLKSNDLTKALSIAKSISEELSPKEQLWLIGWYQQYLWDLRKNIESFRRLEKLRGQIQSHANSRLAWEIALIDIHIT